MNSLNLEALPLLVLQFLLKLNMLKQVTLNQLSTYSDKRDYNKL